VPTTTFFCDGCANHDIRVAAPGAAGRRCDIIGQQASGKATVTDQDEQDRRDHWQALGVRTDIPYPARVYDYLLGGHDNFAADREMAELSLRVMPEVRDSARANRRFLVRAIRFLRDEGIQQFLDIGTGLPTSPSTHEMPEATRNKMKRRPPYAAGGAC
jgi:hypothetical protein